MVTRSTKQVLDKDHFRLHGVWRLRLDGPGKKRKHKLACTRIIIRENLKKIFRFVHHTFPCAILNKLGKFWLKPSTKNGKYKYVYMGETQVSKIEPTLWYVSKELSMTCKEWRHFRKNHLC